MTQITLKLRYKFRLILDETWSYGVLGRTGAGLTSHQNVDATLVDLLIGSLAGPLCAGGGFCAGAADIVEHQRISSASYTFSAALPAMLATTASETVTLLQAQPELVAGLREATRALRGQLMGEAGAKEWVRCSSAAENPVQLLVLREEVVAARGWSAAEQEGVLQEVVDEALAGGVLVTRLKGMPRAIGVSEAQTRPGTGAAWRAPPAVKVCAVGGLSRKEIERAGAAVRHAVQKVMARKR